MSISLFDAADTYSSMLPYLYSIPSLASMSSQFRFWTERLLTRLCKASMALQPLGSWVDFNTMLRMFRLWATFWKDSGSRQIVQAAEPSSVTGSSRWEVWDAYYYTLSQILRRGMIYAPNSGQEQPQLLE